MRGGVGIGGSGGSGGIARGLRPAAAAGLDADGDDGEKGGKRSGGGGKRPRQGGRNMTEQQRLDRRERNREHAKRSRVRKKFLLESLQKSVTALQEENEKLRGAIRSNLSAEEAKELLEQTETSNLIASNPGDATKVLDDPDYSLVKALQTAQQNFVITDPTLPDNPIVFASQGFLELTGYTLDQVLGRNCRFLQGPDTDPKAVEKIRKAIEKGMDTSVCLRNYRVDGVMFWNQFFIAALRDSEGAVINYVGVQCKVDEDFVRASQKKEGDEDGDEDEDVEDEDDRSDADDKAA
uniref:Putative LOV domain-containing protein n=1 Tax=Dictyopteris undulata TaxID=156997 RepID=A0A126WZN1_9PHAE|nr:putative LOV domain-containing protein [Dictyopteris undulata]